MDIEDFTSWAFAHGVVAHNIAIYRLPGKGLGIKAEKDLKAGDTILTVPTSVLRNVQTLPETIHQLIGNTSVNAILAVDLAMDTSDSFSSWRAILPSKEEFDEVMPMMWHPSLQKLLPPTCLMLVEKQQAKISHDWSVVSGVFTTLSYDVFLYYWHAVNSRTFYFTTPEAKYGIKFQHDDCLALVPFADCFNHADSGCEVSFSSSGYEFRTDKVLKKGEEIYACYGKHSNDFLFAEYGFILTKNEWDEVCLDDVYLPLFSENQKRILKEKGFLGNYVLDKDTLCYRSQIALSILCVPLKKWLYLVAHGMDAEDEYQLAIDEIVLKTLKAYLDVVHGRVGQVKALVEGRPCQRETLERRWEQISTLLVSAIARLEN